MSEPTVEIRDCFGYTKNVTKNYFINHWVDHAKELRYLSYRSDDIAMNEVNTIINQVHALAAEEWDRLYEDQNRQG